MSPCGYIGVFALFLAWNNVEAKKMLLVAENMVPQYSDYYAEIEDNAIDNLVPEDVDGDDYYQTEQKMHYKPLKMPFVQPKEKDTYLCYSYDFTDTNADQYIVGFEPNATMNVAHHMLLYGCKTPGHEPGQVWACGEMAGDIGKQYKKGPTCSSGSQIVYAWARDAPKLDLPEGVGFKLGKNSELRSLVLQVHYANVDSFLAGGTDNSGVTLKLTNERLSKLAGVYLLGTGGIVPQGESHLETACKVRQNGLTMHPFAFRTHTHQHGKVVSGYVIKNNKWIKIGKHDPLKPQMFYPVKDTSITVENNDVLAARCTMQNDDGKVVPIGSTHMDEMCNFYMMYWSYAPNLSSMKYCFSSGLPFYRWANTYGLQNAPSDASTLEKEDM